MCARGRGATIGMVEIEETIAMQKIEDAAGAFPASPRV